MNWTKYCKPENWHNAANLFPLLGGSELEDLAQDIKNHGLQDPIVLCEGKLLDGRNRIRACAKVEVTPTFIHWHRNGVSELDFVLAQNLKRRHLTVDQRAALAAELVPTFAEEARRRQMEAGKNGAEGGRGRKKDKPPAQKCAKASKKSAAKAAKFVGGVSARYVERVLSLEKKRPGARERIKRGKLTIREAAKEVDKQFNPRPLHEQFVVPPFSVLDAKQGYWQARKQLWRELGIDSGHNEQHNGSQPIANNESFAETSVFDPVLAECVYKWFSPAGGHVLDPIAGEATKGTVAACLGYQYTGCELREKQVKGNYRQAGEVAQQYLAQYGQKIPRPTWILGDSANLNKNLPPGKQYDLIFTSPPYYDLEIYSASEKDGSAFQTYEKFMSWYQDIFRQAVARLKPNRFLVVKVANMRDEKGFYRNFVGDNISCFQRLGLHLYNDMILATPIGSAPIRVRQQFPNYRKVVGIHQNVLCFFKGGDPKAIPQELGVVELHAKVDRKA